MRSQVCPSCSQPLDVSGTSDACPRCGQPVVALDPSTESIEISVPSAPPTFPARAKHSVPTDKKMAHVSGGGSTALDCNTTSGGTTSSGASSAGIPPTGAPNIERTMSWSGVGPPPDLAQIGGEGSDLTAFLAPPQKPDELGRLGSYRVLKILGAGGMGVVYHAEDLILKRPVAVKAMLPGVAGKTVNRN